MAAFLSGLMASLKGLGDELGFERPDGSGRGLVPAIDSALAGAPGGAARAPGSGGLMAASVGTSAPASPPAAKRPGFFSRINTVDPDTGMSTVDKFDRFGGRLRDIYGDSDGTAGAEVDQRAAGRVSKARQAALAAQIDQLFPGDENAQLRFLWKSAPEKAAAALADVEKSQREAYTLGKGQERGAGGKVVDYNPDSGVDGGVAYRTGSDGKVMWGDRRGPSHGEETADRRLEHDVKQDDRVFDLDSWLKHQQDRLDWAKHAARLRSGGYGTPGVGGAVSGDIENDPEWEIQRAPRR